MKYNTIKPLKNQPYRLYFSETSLGAIGIQQPLISKDGGIFNPIENTGVEIAANPVGSLQMDDNANLNFGSGDFTIEFFANNKRINGSNTYPLYQDVGNQVMSINFAGDSEIIDFTCNGGPNVAIGALTQNTWKHVALVRDGNDIRSYLDGVLVATVDFTGYSFVANTGSGWTFGYSPVLMDEIRISDIARYNSNFTPTAVEFVSDANTVLLLHLNSNITDASGNQTLSLVGTTAYNTSNKVLGTASLEFLGIPVEDTQNSFYVDLTATEMNADAVWVKIPQSGGSPGTFDDILIETTPGSTSPTAEEIWEYADRTLTSGGGGGIDLDTVVADVEAPPTEPTVGELLAILARRLKRDRTRI